MMPKISRIVPYFTITINGYYLIDNITWVDYCDIPDYLTKNVNEIPDYLLFEDYDEARKALYSNISKHYLVRRNDKVEVTRVYKSELVDIDKVQFYDADGKVVVPNVDN